MDRFFGGTYVDLEERREAPLPHRYVHGGFKSTDTRFSFYFPEPSTYEGRFVHFLQGGFGGSEYQAPLFAGIEIAFENGAYLVESNQGHVGHDLSGIKDDPSILAYRASVQSARFSKQLAEEMYGSAPRHGYVFGGSGGGSRSISCLENGPDVYDGAAPFMIGHGALFPYTWSVLSFVEPVLRERLPAIIDAVGPGGSRDPFSVLFNREQREALATLYRAGYPRGAEVLITQTPLFVFAVQALLRTDPEYFEDFWTLPGYAGHDGDPTVAARRVEEKAIVRSVVRTSDIPGYGELSDDINVAAMITLPPDATVGVLIDLPGDRGRFLGSTIRVASGLSAGREVICTGAVGDAVVATLDAAGFEGVQPGDELVIDNRDYLAFAFYHRHLVDSRYSPMRQFIIDEVALYPQRPFNIGERGAGASGRFEGKMIVVQHSQDRECWPSSADEYARQVHEHLGKRTQQQFRLWWIENASHFVPVTKAGRTRLINYFGCFAQAVQDVIRWVEKGVEPPSSTGYQINQWGALALPENAADRGGIQAVVKAGANGGDGAQVRVGEAIRFEGIAEVPPGAGTIARAEWDFDGSGSWPVRDQGLDGSAATVRLEASHSYEKPGTYFATFRVASQREGNVGRSLRLVQNLARIRVVVR